MVAVVLGRMMAPPLLFELTLVTLMIDLSCAMLLPLPTLLVEVLLLILPKMALLLVVYLTTSLLMIMLPVPFSINFTVLVEIFITLFAFPLLTIIVIVVVGVSWVCVCPCPCTCTCGWPYVLLAFTLTFYGLPTTTSAVGGWRRLARLGLGVLTLPKSIGLFRFIHLWARGFNK